MTKPKKEIKPVKGWCQELDGCLHVDEGIYDNKDLVEYFLGTFSEIKAVKVTILPTRDYRKLLADAKAYRLTTFYKPPKDARK